MKDLQLQTNIFLYSIEQLACQEMRRRARELTGYLPELHGREVEIPCQDQCMSGNDVNSGVRIPNCGGLKFPTHSKVYF